MDVKTVELHQDMLSPIEDIIEDARRGKFIVLVDDEDRENEGDLIIPAECVTAEAINFVLYCERQANGKRRVRELIEVKGYDFATQAFLTEDLYRADA